MHNIFIKENKTSCGYDGLSNKILTLRSSQNLSHL